MSNKIKVAVICPILGGVRHYRMEQPYSIMQSKGLLEYDFYNEPIKDIQELNKGYDIVHFHTQLMKEDSQMASAVYNIHSWGGKVVMDIDDYYELPSTHFSYEVFKKQNRAERLKANLSLSDAVTTTTEYYAQILRKYNSNVYVLPNAIDFTEPQFNRQKKQTDRLNYGLLTGSSHKQDVELLRGASNFVNSKMGEQAGTILCGFDLRGVTTKVIYVGDALAKDLLSVGLYKPSVLKDINKVQGNIGTLKYIPKFIIEKYGEVIRPEVKQEKMNPLESVWYYYEKILTDDFRNIKDKNYAHNLHLFNNTDMIGQGHIRIHTRPINKYAESYSLFDLSLAPLKENVFNNCKSNLKMLEAGAYSLPIICSDVVPYNTDGVNGKNCFLLKEKGNDWGKTIVKVLKDSQLRSDLGGELNRLVKEKYDAHKVADFRMECLEDIIKL